MKTQEALRKLELMGTEQNRKIYTRHGVGDNQFGVSFKNLRKIAKEVGIDSYLAEMLWRSGNHDARIIATMIIDVEKITEQMLDRWVDDLDNYVITDAFSNMVNRTEFTYKKAKEWINSSGEWSSSAGWNLVSHLAIDDQSLEDNFFRTLLEIIESTIHERPNRTRYSMNNALIAIGVRNPTLQAEAEKAAEHIGKVKVDHGDTSCKTPQAIPYIRKTLAHRAAKESKQLQ
jgi:3-methyladenine DNA glycosylase AlkD